MGKTKKVRYGISNVIVEPNQTPQKYVAVYDVNGNLLVEVEVYIIGYESEEL